MIWRPLAHDARSDARPRSAARRPRCSPASRRSGLLMWSIGFIDSGGADPLLFRGGFFVTAIATLAVIAAVTHPRTITSTGAGHPGAGVDRAAFVRPVPLSLADLPADPQHRRQAHEVPRVRDRDGASRSSITELSYRYIETPIRKGALGKLVEAIRDTRDPGRRNAVLAGAFVGTALAIFGVTSLATAELKQNDVQQSLTRARESTCDVLADPTCSGRRRPRRRPASDPAADVDAGDDDRSTRRSDRIDRRRAHDDRDTRRRRSRRADPDARAR